MAVYALYIKQANSTRFTPEDYDLPKHEFLVRFTVAVMCFLHVDRP